MERTGFRHFKLQCHLTSIIGKQTIPRAELTGADSGGRLGKPACRTDCLYVARGADKFGERVEDSQCIEPGNFPLLDKPNGDLWRQLTTTYAETGCQPAAKVKGHELLSNVLQGQASFTDFIGNHIADAFARIAAVAAEDPLPVQQLIAGTRRLPSP
eukprot:TRINITY_DN11216_c0_g1_i2.p2 TRINITY_DN11216_c0_g1~~TRINITY_DN11216_c0_g1_i2.p2  ORF type:complete len:157 (-),score=31.46 TRINITY_DN11216_c0_g1_i2:802-1272(-)